MKKLFLELLELSVLLLLLSCNNNDIYNHYQSIDDEGWSNKNNITFDFEVDDTISLHNMYIYVRHNQEYQFNNLWLFIKSSAPNGKISIDTVECLLADNKGKWFGRGLGDIFDLEILWGKNVRFPLKGRYVVEYQQAMRVDNLQGIKKMGLRIEKIQLTQ